LKKYNLKKICILAVCILIIILVICRVSYVTKNARVPDLNVVPQGDSVVYKGLGYRIVDAALWEYDYFFEQNENLNRYKEELIDNEIMLLVVEMEITKEGDNGYIDYYMPIKYFYGFNGVSPFMFADMNPSLVDGTFHSGDHIYVVYEIYKNSLLESQWSDVVNFQVEYRILLGSYPEKNELQITDIRRGGAE